MTQLQTSVTEHNLTAWIYGRFSLLFLLQQSLSLVQSSLDLFNAFVRVFGGTVELLLQQAEADVRLAQLLSLKTRTQWLCSSAFLFSVNLQRERCVCVFTYLDLERLLQLFDDRLSVLQLHAEAFSISDFSSESRWTHIHGWRVLRGDNRMTSKLKKLLILLSEPKTTAERNHVRVSHLVLRLLWVILSLLHGGGHLVHGCYDDAAWLPQTLVGVGALGSIDLKMIVRYFRTRTVHRTAFVPFPLQINWSITLCTCSPALNATSSSLTADSPSCSPRGDIIWAPAAATSCSTATTQVRCFLQSERVSDTCGTNVSRAKVITTEWILIFILLKW